MAEPDTPRELGPGDRLAANGDLAGAEKAYRAAAEGGDPHAATKLGLLLEHRGRRKEALAAYAQADEGGDGLGSFRHGMLLSAIGDWSAAQEAWARADERGRDPVGYDLQGALGPGAPSVATRAVGAPASGLANPILVGALAVLALTIAVFLAYDANSGLPFVPTRELKVVVGDGSDLVLGNDVREGGFRVGLVSDLRPVRLASGLVGALLTLKLDQAHGRVPVDSTASVLPRNLLGLKYVQLNRGVSSRVFADGATLPVSRTSVPVQFDDVFKTFDARTRLAIQRSLVGAGDVLAGRGSSLNDTIASLPGLLGRLEPVARYLSRPSGGLSRFFRDLNGFVGAVAPVVGAQVRFFSEAATTFRAISSDPGALSRTISLSPGTLSTGAVSLRAQMPLLVDLTSFGRNLTPAAAALSGALPTINPAIEVGTRVLARTPSLNRGLQGVMVALRNLALAPGTNIAINALGDTSSTLNPVIRYLGPYQTVCDYWNYWWTNLSEHLSQPTSYGFSQRALLNLAQPGTNSVQQVGAVAPANGESGTDSLGIFGGQQFLHSQSYGAAIDTHGNADCEVGQRGYPQKLTADPQGRKLVTDAHTPGDQGPTYKGRSHVPAGETFTRAPTTGPSAG